MAILGGKGKLNAMDAALMGSAAIIRQTQHDLEKLGLETEASAYRHVADMLEGATHRTRSPLFRKLTERWPRQSNRYDAYKAEAIMYARYAALIMVLKKNQSRNEACEIAGKAIGMNGGAFGHNFPDSESLLRLAKIQNPFFKLKDINREDWIWMIDFKHVLHICDAVSVDQALANCIRNASENADASEKMKNESDRQIDELFRIEDIDIISSIRTEGLC